MTCGTCSYIGGVVAGNTKKKMLQRIKSKSGCTSGETATFVFKWRKSAAATPASCVANSLVMLITAMQITSSDETPSSQLTIS